LYARDVPIRLNTRLERLVVEAGRVVGLEVSRHGTQMTLGVRHAVVLAAGGFEQSQTLRDRYFPAATDARWSLTPRHANSGDALSAGQAIGAAIESMSCAWWAPSMQLPSREFSNIEVSHQMFFDTRHPHSLCVNRLARRFVNESCSYDRFGMAMIEDQKRTGANIPCWLIFDAAYRVRYSAGGIMPSSVMPDQKIPREWWDTYLYRAATVEALAVKLDLAPAELGRTVARLNEQAKTGTDPDFGRGDNAYDRYFGDARVTPNPCLAPVATPPFYAVRIDLGDLGTKGGLKTDANAQVMRADGSLIEGLFAAGNCAGSPFGDCYPGAGATLGAAAVFAFVAANAIARRAISGS
jgi:3-oxosteroid 1-dehydrogenase